MALPTQGLPGQNDVYNALEFGGEGEESTTITSVWLSLELFLCINASRLQTYQLKGPAKGRSKFSLGIGSKIEDVLTGLAWNGYWFYAQVKQV